MSAQLKSLDLTVLSNKECAANAVGTATALAAPQEGGSPMSARLVALDLFAGS